MNNKVKVVIFLSVNLFITTIFTITLIIGLTINKNRITQVQSEELETPEIVNNVEDLFVSPGLTCPGYEFTRGMLSWHNGIDIAKNDGCWINSIGAGEVISAGWGNYGEGYHVIIDHKNGYTSLYYHGNGEFRVKIGDFVEKGQEIMYMGCSGNCTSTHLHLIVYKNDELINPLSVLSL